MSVKAGNLVLKMEPIHARHSEERTLHKPEHFDREHVRTHKDLHDQTFWIDHDLLHENEKNKEKESNKDAILFDHKPAGLVSHRVYDHDADASSDSDDDWEDY